MKISKEQFDNLPIEYKQLFRKENKGEYNTNIHPT